MCLTCTVYVVHVSEMTTRLHQYLTERKLTNVEFGGMIGRTPSSVSRIRQGKVNPDWETLERIFDATGGIITPNDFFSRLFSSESGDASNGLGSNATGAAWRRSDAS